MRRFLAAVFLARFLVYADTAPQHGEFLGMGISGS
jgi:hypothetical protein